jgi:hypothetical protein
MLHIDLHGDEGELGMLVKVETGNRRERDQAILLQPLDPSPDSSFRNAKISRNLAVGDACVLGKDIDQLAEMNSYLDFVEDRRPGAEEGAFSCLSLGFSPFEQDISGEPHIYVWHLVMGDFAAFHRAKCARLAKGVLPTTDLIRLPG